MTSSSCDICCSSESILNCDTVHLAEDVSAHYFCLLFSSGLGQRGEEKDGIKGFLVSDIKREVRRGSRLKCVYCRKKGATVGCAEQRCKKSYHPICGKNHNSLYQFFDQFKSFCKEHRPLQNVKKVESLKANPANSNCTICQEKIVRKATFKTLWVPCCSSFFHRDCVQSQAISAGKGHLRCANCNDSSKFIEEIKMLGVYVPEQDASWEDGSQFNDIDREINIACHAKICFCPFEDGRLFHDENKNGGVWEIFACNTCGSKGIHGRCGGLEEVPDSIWHCYTCREGLRDRGEEETYLKHTNKFWDRRIEIFHSSSHQSFSSEDTSIPPSPEPLFAPRESGDDEKIFTKLVVPIIKPPPMDIPVPNLIQKTNKRQDIIKAPITKINSETTFTDLLGSMLDTGDGSPGDSDYESSQDTMGNGSINASLQQKSDGVEKKKIHVRRLTLSKSETSGLQSRMTDFFPNQKNC